MPYLSYKYRLYPDKQQRRLFIMTCGCARLVYNHCLDLETRILDMGDTPASQRELVEYLSNVLVCEYPFLMNVDFSALCHATFNLYNAYRRYWDHVSDSPKFKSKARSHNTFRTSADGIQYAMGPDYIAVPLAGRVKAVIHRPLPELATIRALTITQEPNDKFFCSVLFYYSPKVARLMCDKTNSIGLDYCAEGLYTDSRGKTCGAPRYRQDAEKKLKRERKRLNKKVGAGKDEKPSKNYLKQLKKLNETYQKTVNRRNDFLHKKSAELVSKYDFICVENLKLNEMADRKEGFGKSTMDNAYGRFIGLLDYKARAKGKHLVRVDRWFPSSQICSRCGSRVKMELSQRVFICPCCELGIDRDYNAAINIRREGMRNFDSWTHGRAGGARTENKSVDMVKSRE